MYNFSGVGGSDGVGLCQVPGLALFCDNGQTGNTWHSMEFWLKYLLM